MTWINKYFWIAPIIFAVFCIVLAIVNAVSDITGFWNITIDKILSPLVVILFTFGLTQVRQDSKKANEVSCELINRTEKVFTDYAGSVESMFCEMRSKDKNKDSLESKRQIWLVLQTKIDSYIDLLKNKVEISGVEQALKKYHDAIEKQPIGMEHTLDEKLAVEILSCKSYVEKEFAELYIKTRNL